MSSIQTNDRVGLPQARAPQPAARVGVQPRTVPPGGWAPTGVGQHFDRAFHDTVAGYAGGLYNHVLKPAGQFLNANLNLRGPAAQAGGATPNSAASVPQNLRAAGLDPRTGQAPGHAPAAAANPDTPAPAGGAAPAPLRADQANAAYDQRGYGPHSTEAQFNTARHAVVSQNAAMDRTRVGLNGSAQADANPAARVGVPASATTPTPTPTPAEAGAPAADPFRQRLLKQYDKLANPEMPGWVRSGNNYTPATAEDEHARQAHMAALANALNGNAQVDPMNPVRVARAFGEDPVAQAGAMATQAGHNATPEQAQFAVQQALAQRDGGGATAFNATNYEQAARNPATAGALAILQSDAPIHEKAAAFAAIPGVEQPNSPHRQLWDAWMARQQARGPEFDQELGQYNPTDPTHQAVHSNPVGQFFGAFGGDARTQQRNQRFAQDMGRLGYGPARVGVPAAADSVRARVGVRRNDY
jgi:hypothetical protein